MKTIGTCKSCEWYGELGIGGGVNGCNNPVNGLFHDGNDGCNPVASHGEYTWIECGPNFGCIHWEKKEKPKR